MIDGSEKRNRQLAFELENSHVCEKRINNCQPPKALKFNRQPSTVKAATPLRPST